MDCALSDVGLSQARKLGQRLINDLAKDRFTHVFSSDLQRASETARTSLREYCGREATLQPASQSTSGLFCTDGGLLIHTDRLLRECRFGSGEGKTYAEMRMMCRGGASPDGAETERQLHERARIFFQKVNEFALDVMRSPEYDAAEALPEAPGPSAGTLHPERRPHIAVYSHGGWIASFFDVVKHEAHFTSPLKLDQLASRGCPNTGVARFNVTLDELGGKPYVTCLVAHDASHLD